MQGKPREHMATLARTDSGDRTQGEPWNVEGAVDELLHHFRQHSKAHGFPCEAALRPEAMGCVGRVFHSGEVRSVRAGAKGLWGCDCHATAAAVLGCCADHSSLTCCHPPLKHSLRSGRSGPTPCWLY